MARSEVTEIVVSPRIVCPCGKAILRMTEEQKALYDNALSKRYETKSREEEKHTVETLPMIECVTNDSNHDATHADKLDVIKYNY